MKKQSTFLFSALMIWEIPLACSPVKKGSISSQVLGEEMCSSEPSNFVGLPANCQYKILSHLSDKELVRFAKAVSKSSGKAGFETLLYRAKSSVPESLQLEMERYVAMFNECMGFTQQSSTRDSPVFVEKLITFYLAYLKLMNTNYPRDYFSGSTAPKFEIGSLSIRTPVSPIVLGKRNILSIVNNKGSANSMLEVHDSVTFKLKSTKPLDDLQGAADLSHVTLHALGPQSFLVSDRTKTKQLWTFDGNSWKRHKTFGRDVAVFGYQKQDIVVTIERNHLKRYTLKSGEFQEIDFGVFSSSSPEAVIILKPDQIVSLETKGEESLLKTWNLSSRGINLLQTSRFEGRYREFTRHDNSILSFIVVRKQQYSYIFYDSGMFREVLRINEPFDYGSPYWNHQIKFINDKTFAISQREHRSSYPIHVYGVPQWDRVEHKGVYSHGYNPLVPPFVVYEKNFIVYQTYPSGVVRFQSIEDASRSFRIFPFSREGYQDGSDNLESAEGAFLIIRNYGFTIYSPWNNVYEKYRSFL